MGTLDIRSFLATPYPEKAHSKTVDFLDAHSPSLDDLNGLEALLLQAKEHHEAQQSTVRSTKRPVSLQLNRLR